jgi:Ca-activated chloride channel homolog
LRILKITSAGFLLCLALPADERIRISPRAEARGNAATAVRRPPSIRIDSTLVQINVTVTAPWNRVVTGLEKEHFQLFEDKVEQPIVAFSTEEAPISAGLVFDISGSMGAKLQKARQAAAAFFKTSNPGDEFFLIQFNDRPELSVPFTREPSEIQSRLMFTRAKGRTALLDGVYLALSEMKHAKNSRKAILILSDGADNSSRYSENELRQRVREADVQIYAMGIFERRGSRGTAEERAGPMLLNQIAEETGGRHFPVRNINYLPDTAAKISLELRSQYLLGYRPANLQKDGRYRRVEVRVAQLRGLPPLRPRYRTGYYAPAE